MTKTERERLQEIACDLCHQPYACANEDELAKACEECPISAEMCEMEEEPNTQRARLRAMNDTELADWLARRQMEAALSLSFRSATRWAEWLGEKVHP